MTEAVAPRAAVPTGARTAPGLPRALAAAVVATAALAAVARHAWYRGAEAAMAARCVHALLGLRVGVSRTKDMFFFEPRGSGLAHFMGLGVSLGCSSLLLVAPAAEVTVVLLLTSRISPLRLALALAVVATMIVAFNIVRLTFIAVLVNAWGVETGFGWAHSFFGTLLTLVGLSAAAFLYITVLRLGRRRTVAPAAVPPAAEAV